MPTDNCADAMDNSSLPTSLAEALIPSLPAWGYYIPNFITEIEEAHLLQKVNSPDFGVPFPQH